jgi:hypothetical protein
MFPKPILWRLQRQRRGKLWVRLDQSGLRFLRRPRFPWDQLDRQQSNPRQ